MFNLTAAEETALKVKEIPLIWRKLPIAGGIYMLTGFFNEFLGEG